MKGSNGLQTPARSAGTMNETSHQAELPLTNETVLEALPEEAKTQCRQLLGQMLREVLQAEKEGHNEQ